MPKHDMSTPSARKISPYAAHKPNLSSLKDPMMSLADPLATQIPSDVLEAPGGFAWWYVDAVNNHGDGIVLIWSFGLPFLPGYLNANRNNQIQTATQRPSLNIAIYSAGRPSFYLLQEYAQEEASMDQKGNFKFGDTYIRRVSNREIIFDISCPIPSYNYLIEGTLKLSGSPVNLPPNRSVDHSLNHRWTPVFGPSKIKGRLSAGPKYTYTVDTLAYHDRNEGALRLDQLGIAHWSWGRLVTPQQTTIWYICFPHRGEPQAWGINILPDGACHIQDDLNVTLTQPYTGIFGLKTWGQVSLQTSKRSSWLTTKTLKKLDEGPFYARTLSSIESNYGQGLGFSEWVAPDRVDLNIHRPLVQMAVHKIQGSNSLWLPLFSGPSQGRVSRLLGGRKSHHV